MAISIILAVLGFGIIILVHELGHFITARLFKVTVNEFSIGMGPKLFSKKRNGTVYSLRALPVGGYVSMAGEEEESDDPNSFDKKSAFARFIILFSGAFMNLLLGFVLMLLCVVSSNAIYSNKIEAFLEKDAAEYCGLAIGDEIIAVNGDSVGTRHDYLFTSMRVKGSCTLTVKRNGEKIDIPNFSFGQLTSDEMTVSDPSFFIPAQKEKTFFNVLYETAGRTGASVKMVFFSLIDLVSGKYSMEAVSGPVGVVNEIHESAKYGFESVVFLLALIAINIGIFNLLPFPALDGGRIFFIGIEKIIRRPINKKVETAINFAGLMILFGFMIAITFKDIFSLF